MNVRKRWPEHSSILPRLLKVGLIGLSTAFLFACTTMPGSDRASDKASSDTAITMDTTIGSYGQGREERLILVTMAEADHQLMTAGISGSEQARSTKILPERYADFLEEAKTKFGIARVADWPLPAIGIYCLVFETDGSQDRDSIVAGLEAMTAVETAQAVQMFSLQSGTYNDPYLKVQHGFKTMQVAQSHEWASGNGISIAVIDTGLDQNHSDLKDNLLESRNFVDTRTADFNRDIHGTAIAGVIAASGNNKSGMVGIAPGAKLSGLKACWQTGATQAANCNTYTLAKAINVAIAKNVDIINLSLAGPRDRLLERLVKKALDKNIIVVGAVPPEVGSYFPVSVDGTLAATLPENANENHFGAPGKQVLSTAPQDKYNFFDGSSFSTAHLTGLAALMREIAPTLSPKEMKQLLLKSVDPATGSINACLALASLKRLPANICSTEVLSDS